ncbi:MAG: prepilin-type N-terminal cleavage/methylation domain-containing protein [Candidatus Woesebacteria bacterium]|jgi:prepilin-type N-terminal cleavage/methylation domain-containing protein
MSIQNKQKGFTIIEILIVIAVIALIVFGGWWVYTQNNKSDTATSTTTTEVVSEEDINNEVIVPQNADDLKKLDTQLNDASLGDTEVSDLSSQLDF